MASLDLNYLVKTGFDNSLSKLPTCYLFHRSSDTGIHD